MTSPLAETEPPTRRERLRARLGDARRRLGRVRPAAVGSGAVALVVALVVGRLVLGLGAAVQALLTGAVFAAAVYALASDRPPVQALGAALLLPAGLLELATLGLPATAAAGSVASGLAVLATVLAVAAVGFVAALSGSDVPDDGRLSRANSRAGSALVGPVVLLGVLLVPNLGLASRVTGLVGEFVGTAFGHLLATPPDLAPFVFPVLLAATAILLRRALRAVPLDVLVAPERREAVVTRLASVERGAGITIGASVVLLVGGLAATAAGGSFDLDGFRAGLPEGLADPAATLVTATALRALLVLVAAASLLVATAVRLLGFARRASPQSVAQRLAPSLGGLLAAGTIAALLTTSGVAGSLQERLADAVGPGLFGLVSGFDPFALGVVVALLAVFVAGAALRTLGFLVLLMGTRRAVGPALAGLATFLLAAVALLVGAGALAFGAAALAIVAWDLGEYGRGLGEELVADAPTTRAEVTHAAGSLGVGLVAVVAALAVGALLAGAAALPSSVGLLALVLATGASVLLLTAL